MSSPKVPASVWATRQARAVLEVTHASARLEEAAINAADLSDTEAWAVVKPIVADLAHARQAVRALESSRPSAAGVIEEPRLESTVYEITGSGDPKYGTAVIQRFLPDSWVIRSRQTGSCLARDGVWIMDPRTLGDQDPASLEGFLADVTHPTPQAALAAFTLISPARKLSREEASSPSVSP